MVNTGPVEPSPGSYPSAPWSAPVTPVTPVTQGSPTPPAPGSGPAAPPPSSSRQVAGAFLFVFVLVGLAVAFAWYRAENPTPEPGTAAALPTLRPTAGAAATARPTPVSPVPTRAPTAAPTEPATADAILLAAIAESVRGAADCAPIAATPDFATARSTIFCRFRSGTIAGVTFRLYDDPAAAQAAYDAWQDVLRDVGESCDADSFEGPWAADGRDGRLLCYTAEDGRGFLFWTDGAVPVVGVAWREDGFLKGLHAWWQERYPLAGG